MFCFLTRTREAFLFCSQEQQRTELAPSFLPNENYVLQICEICVISSSRKQHFVFEKVKFQTSKHFPTTQNSKKQFWKVVSVRYTRYPIFDIIIIIYHDRLFIFPCMYTWWIFWLYMVNLRKWSIYQSLEYWDAGVAI